jgi:hypothetical protein
VPFYNTLAQAKLFCLFNKPSISPFRGGFQVSTLRLLSCQSSQMTKELNNGTFNITIRPRVLLLQILATALFLSIVFYSGIVQVQIKPGQLMSKLNAKRWYNEDLESVFSVSYLPFSIDDPREYKGVSRILDNHNVKDDERYEPSKQDFYEAWGKLISRGPISNDKRVYIAVAEGKGHGVFAEQLLKAGELVSVYTGIIVMKERDRDSTYQWSYKVTDVYGNRRYHLDTDSRLSGNMMRFVNDDPGGPERNLVMIEVWAGLG